MIGLLLALAAFHVDDPEPDPRVQFQVSAFEGEELDEMIVTGSRSRETLYDFPGAASAFREPEFMSGRMPRDLPAILAEEPGVVLQRTAYGQASPFFRGLTGYHTVALIDGIRLNNSVMRAGPNQYWTTIDSLALGRVESIRGTKSVLYGSDAITGVINALYREQDEFGEGVDFGGMIHTRYASAENSYSTRLEADGHIGESFGFVVGGTYRNFGDFDAGRHQGNQPETGYREGHMDGKLTFKIQDSGRLVFAHQRARLEDVPRTHRTIFGQSYRGTTVGSELRRTLDQERDLTYAKLLFEDAANFLDKGALTLSYHVQGEERDRIRSDGRRDVQGFNVRTLGLIFEAEADSDLGLWTYGADYYLDDVNSFRDDYAADGSFSGSRIQGPVGDEATYDLAGVYVRDRYPLSDRFDLIGGLRFTYAAADADRVADPENDGGVISIDESWNSIVGDIGIAYEATEALTTYATVSQGFRAPNLSDLTRFDSARSGETETPSPDLDPEEFITFELGAKAKDETFTVEGSYFYTMIEDLIARTPTGATIDGEPEITKLNSGDGLVHGIELAASYVIDPKWSLFGNFTWITGRVETFPTSTADSDDEPINRLPPIVGRLGGRFEPPEKGYFLEALMTVASEADRLSPRDEADTQRIPPGGTPAYTVFSLRGGIDVSPRLRVSGAIENITNRDYRIHGSGSNEPGTNVVLGVTVFL